MSAEREGPEAGRNPEADRPTEDQREAAADAIRERLRSEPLQGSKQLLEFARNYAPTPSVRLQAPILRQSLLHAPDADHQASVVAELLAFVDAVVADHAEHAGSEGVEKAERARMRVRAHYLEQELQREVVFECSGLGKTYRKSGFTLRGVDLTLRRGQITGVVGENGNGKTTLFNIVAGELAHDAGTLSYPTVQSRARGVDWTGVARILAYVPQELPRWHGSLVQNLQYEAAIHGILGQRNREEVEFMIARLGLDQHRHKPWAQLSGGFKLRFALARALVWRPRILILDEPLGNLDFKAQLTVLKDIRSLANTFRDPMAVLISSQHLHEVEAVADDLLFLRDGQVVFHGPTGQIGDDRRHSTFEIGTPVSEAELRRALSGLSIRRVHHSGVAFVVDGSVDLTGRRLLEALTAADVTVDYFRDVSRSVKGLF